MFIRKLEIRGIRSWVDGTIEFKEGFTVILGTKGAGKSSIIRAIIFALLGQQATGDYSTILREGAQKGFVRLHLEDQGHAYILTRGLLRKETKIEQDASVLKLEMDGELIAGEKSKRVAEELTHRLGQNKEIIQSTWYVKQEALKEILNIDPRQRKIKLDRLFGFEAYNRAYDEMGGAVKHWEGKLQAQTEASHKYDIKNLEIERTEIQKEIKKSKTARKKIDGLLKTAQKKVARIKEQFQSLREDEKEFNERSTRLDTLRESTRRNKEIVKRHQMLIKEKTRDLAKRKKLSDKTTQSQKKLLQRVNASLTDTKEIKTIKKLDSVVKKLNKKINDLEADVKVAGSRLLDLQSRNLLIEGKEECEYCGQSLSSEKAQETLVHRKEHIGQLEGDIREYEKQVAHYSKEYDLLKTNLEEGQTLAINIQNQSVEMKNLKGEIKDLKEREKEYKGTLDSCKKQL
ncbi:MAG: AAA family ATPase [Candidatus Ranarchaeia archaeon]|jgi:DNA repair exonuclease SbcCD ATPase subunit